MNVPPPLTPILPPLIVELRSAGLVADDVLAAALAALGGRGAGAEVVAIVQTSAGDTKLVDAVANVALPKPVERLWWWRW